jgi:hypothetical protein
MVVFRPQINRNLSVFTQLFEQNEKKYEKKNPFMTLLPKIFQHFDRFMTFLPQMLLWLMAFYDVVAQKIEVFSEYCLISQNF